MCSVSVVVNTIDRAASLAVLLAALEQQAYPPFELIVVVGPTRDRTPALLAAYAGRVRVLHCPRANLSQSRNIGLLAARGEIVAFIDDDAVPCRTWLAQITAAFADPAVAVVGGSVYLVHPQQPALQHWLGVISDLAEQQDVLLDQVGGVAAARKGRFWTERPMGTNMAFRRRVLLAAGGFDAYYQWVFDDADVAMRLALDGHKVRSLTEAPVYHVPASSRNRVARTFTGRWWIVTQAATYFAVQNGRTAGQPWLDILVQVLHLIHGAWLGSGQLYGDGHISWRQMWSRRICAITAGSQGALQGLGKRRLLPRAPQRKQPFAPTWQPEAGAPAVDPISGARAGASGPALAAAPLRIGLIAGGFAAPAAALPAEAMAPLAPVTQALFARGHTVHVLGAGAVRTIVFAQGAYIHMEPPPADPTALCAGVRRLINNDGIQLLLGPPAEMAAAVNALTTALTTAPDSVPPPAAAAAKAPALLEALLDGSLAGLAEPLQPLARQGWTAAFIGDSPSEA